MIWQIATGFRAHDLMYRLIDAVPPKFTWTNLQDLNNVTFDSIGQHADHEFWETSSLAFSLIPTPRLRVTDPRFTPDYFQFQAYPVVSLSLRRLLDLNDRVVRYRNIDTTLCIPEVQALGYSLVDVIQYANPFDPNRTSGQVRDVRQSDGSLRREWVVDYAVGVECYFRDDFVPPAPLFRGTGTLWTFATDELAERVMRAGIDDMLFQDIEGPHTPVRERMRQLR